MGNKNYLLKDKEAYIVATSEIYGAHVIPRDIHTFTDELQQVLHDVGVWIVINDIKPLSAQRYACRLIQRVNINKEISEVQKRRTITGMIKVFGLNHKKENKSDPRIGWFMFHNIYRMYSDIKKKR